MSEDEEWSPKSTEKYMEAAEKALSQMWAHYHDAVTLNEQDIALMDIAATTAAVNAQLAQVSVLNSLGSLIGLHPVLTHVMATQNMVLERDAVIEAQANEIAQLRVASAAAENPEATDGKPN